VRIIVDIRVPVAQGRALQQRIAQKMLAPVIRARRAEVRRGDLPEAAGSIEDLCVNEGKVGRARALAAAVRCGGSSASAHE